MTPTASARLLAALLLGAPLACAREPSPAPPAQAQAQAPVTIYTARLIHTMDPARPTASAVAVADGRIVGVGDAETLRADLARAAAVRIDDRFAQATLLPGLIDNHIHPIMAAVLLPMEFTTPYDWDLPGRRVPGVRGREAFLARLRALERVHEPGAPLFAWGYHGQFHGPLSRADLNAVSDTRPIVAWHRSFHEVIVNDAALAWMGVTESDVAGHPHVDWARGHFYETGLPIAIAKLNPTILSPAWIAKGLDLTRRAIHGGGITTIADMAAGIFDLEREWLALRQLFEGDDVPFRTLLVPNAGGLGLALGEERARGLIATLPQRNTHRLRFVKQIKLLADGAFYSQLMQLGEGYLDGHHGEWLMTPEQLLEVARPYWKAGYQIHVHANGDLGVAAALDALETLASEHPRTDHRFTLHHLGYSEDAQSLRMARLGALVSANPFYLYALGDAYSEVGLGPERASHMVRLGSLARAGVPISLHSDFTMAPSQPLRLAWVAANRIAASGRVLAPDERLSVEHALRAVTIDAAHAIRMEHEIGSIEVGKRADFTVLGRDPMTVPPAELADVPVLGTVFEGVPFPLADGGADPQT